MPKCEGRHIHGRAFIIPLSLLHFDFTASFFFSFRPVVLWKLIFQQMLWIVDTHEVLCEEDKRHLLYNCSSGVRNNQVAGPAGMSPLEYFILIGFHSLQYFGPMLYSNDSLVTDWCRIGICKVLLESLVSAELL